MENRWVFKPLPDVEVTNELMSKVNLPKPLASILAQRGCLNFEEAKAYFRPELKDLHNPFLMKDMAVAVDRIIEAINQNENILVYGDYDVDGTTAVSLVYNFLNSFYNQVSYYIPDRYEEGYGISIQSIDFAEDNDISLIIALDCGIKAIEQITYAKDKNIDFIVCDHHLPGELLPDAFAILNPKRSDCNYPYKHLSGCGIGFKLIQALGEKKAIDTTQIYDYLDLVCVSIAADIVPITGENRIMMYFGLHKLNHNPRMAFEVMIPDNLKGKMNVSNVVFVLSPRINAAGRIQHGSCAVQLLSSSTKEEANNNLKEIENLNNTRKTLDNDITVQALKQIKDNQQETNYSTVVYHPNWHKGVIGIVASRLIETYYRPTFVFADGKNDELVASARSVKGFDLYQAIDENADILVKYGGHFAAAGLTLKKDKLDYFQKRIEETVKKNIELLQRIPSIEIDLELNFDEINGKFLRILKQMEPFGPENMTPVFYSKNIIADEIKLMGKKNEHLRALVYQKQTHHAFQAVAFGLGDFCEKIKSNTFEMLYSLEENHWQGKSNWQLNVKDIRFS